MQFKKTLFLFFGNPVVRGDELALSLIEPLSRAFPEHEFAEGNVDELGELARERELVLIDVVKGIGRVTVFEDVDAFAEAPRITMHDADLGTELKLLEKAEMLGKIRVIGIPWGYPEKKALQEVEREVEKIISAKS